MQNNRFYKLKQYVLQPETKGFAFQCLFNEGEKDFAFNNNAIKVQ